MTRTALVLAALGLLLAVPSGSRAEPLQVIIMGGGPTSEDAAAALARFKAEAKDVASVATLAAGFPAIRASDELEGLKPGFQIVTVGFCPQSEVTDLLDVLRPFYPGTYARTVKGVTLDAPACPVLLARKESEESVPAGKGLRLVLTFLGGDEVSLVRAALVQKDGAVLDAETLDVTPGQECSAASVEPRGAGFVLRQECAGYFREMCNFAPSSSTWRVVAKDGKLEVRAKHEGGERIECGE
ncbi:MAG TPA: hypothetical protein VEB43_06915 [Anaeromyxobacter sp.]|nr:hypothetical protein [Anaeromyxobacter sp.]